MSSSRKAQFGLDTVLSWIVFGLFLFVTILVLSIAGCGRNSYRISHGIETDTGGIPELRASEQLSAYLRTEMPDLAALELGIDALKGRGTMASTFDAAKAKEFLREHPEVYAGRTYGSFIAALYNYRDEDGNSLKDKRSADAFDAVTKAMFVRNRYSKDVREITGGRLDAVYDTPTISVKFGAATGIYDTSWDWISSDPLSLALRSTPAFKVLPASGDKVITVKLEIYSQSIEKDALPLP